MQVHVLQVYALGSLCLGAIYLLVKDDFITAYAKQWIVQLIYIDRLEHYISGSQGKSVIQKITSKQQQIERKEKRAYGKNG